MSKKKNKKIKAGYQRIGMVVGVDTTIIQAASLLDEASVVAVESKDTATTLALAKSWMELGAMMHVVLEGGGEPEKEDDEDDDHKGSSILGFGPTEARERAEALARAKKNQG